MSEDTYYTVLGVSEDATPLEIRTAYRNLLKQIHPDTVSTLSPELKREAEIATKEINEAYELLSDPSLRRQYDEQLSEHWQQDVDAPARADRNTIRWQGPARIRVKKRHRHHRRTDTHWIGEHPLIALGYLLVALMTLVAVIYLFSLVPGSDADDGKLNAQPYLHYCA